MRKGCQRETLLPSVWSTFYLHWNLDPGVQRLAPMTFHGLPENLLSSP
jgi:hypothetical protein